jgi:hypothetical protein
LSADIELDHVRIDGSEHLAIGTNGSGTLRVTDSAITNAVQIEAGVDGIGLGSLGAGQITAERVRIAHCPTWGVVATGDGSTATVSNSVIDDVALGLNADSGGVVNASGVSVSNAREGGIFAGWNGTLIAAGVAVRGVTDDARADGVCALVINAATMDLRESVMQNCLTAGVWVERASATLDNVLVADVAPGRIGYGIGVASVGSQELGLSRVSIERVHGFGLGALSSGPPDRPSGSLVGTDIFVRTVAEGHIQPANAGPAVSYGLEAAQSSNLTLSRVVTANAEIGFENSDGTISIDNGVVTGSVGEAGSIASPASMLTLASVSMFGNANDGIVTRADLPAAAAFDAPPDPCTNDGCL